MIFQEILTPENMTLPSVTNAKERKNINILFNLYFLDQDLIKIPEVKEEAERYWKNLTKSSVSQAVNI